MSEKSKMSRKRRISAIDECNNNDTETESMERHSSKKRILAQLQSDLTDKMILPVKSPKGQLTSRFGRKITYYESPQPQQSQPSSHQRTRKSMTEHSKQTLSKRKVRKVFSIHNISANVRLVSNRPTTVLTKSPIQKLISLTKNGLNNNQFQTHNDDNCAHTEPPIIDLCVELSATEPNFFGQMDEKTVSNTSIDNIDIEDSLCAYRVDEATKPNDLMADVDIEDSLCAYRVEKRTKQRTESFDMRNRRTESFEIVDEIDLTSSTEGSENGDNDTKTNADESEQLVNSTISTTELVTTTPAQIASQHKTDNPKTTFATPNEMAELTIPLTDCCSPSTPRAIGDSIVFSDKPYSESTSDDCVIADADDEHSNIDSTDTTWYVGQIVWAALFGYPFWPAIVFNCEEEHKFHKDNQVHVKFLYDNGRRNWVNEKTSILPFKGRDEFVEKSKVPANKRNKAYKLNSTKRWEMAIHEANVLLCIKREHRVEFYDVILLNAVQDMDRELRSIRRKTGDRCDTPQTFDTAYSSMKQSSSPASLSPTLNELDRNYDVDKNINNYLKSVELSRPEELPEEDLQMDESPTYAVITESPSSTDQIYCRLTKLVYDKIQNPDISFNQSAIFNENEFVAILNEFWSKMTDLKMSTATKTGSPTKRTSRRFSIDSTVSGSSTFTENQTARQRTLAKKKEMAEAKKKQMIVDEQTLDLLKKKPSKEEVKQQKLKIIEDIIQDCCMKNHPANFLLKGLAKDPVCQCCLESGNVMKCAGKCSAYFHKECLSKIINETAYNAILKRKMLRDDDEDDGGIAPSSCIEDNTEQLKCTFCTTSSKIPCFVCSKSEADCIQCCDKNCGKAYHIECLKYWPQHKKTYVSNTIKSLHCPRHVCQTCVSPDIRNMFHSTESDKKLIKCLLCPGTYHRSSECIPAGSELLSESQLICARHQSTKNLKRINIDYCLFCSLGGELICCDACVYSFHSYCLNVPVGDNYNCEECESGRRPLNGEIVWCKYSNSPWWPAIIVPPPCIPERVLVNKKEPNQICVYFFGTHNYGWVLQSHIYLYITGDGDCKSKNEKELLKNAVAEAEQWMKKFNEINEKSIKQNNKNRKPPPYKKIKTNKLIAKFEEAEYNECKCRPDDPAPCSIESNCYNAVLNIECDPNLCPAKEKCQNQNFHRGEQFEFDVKITASKGWGLFAKEEIPVDRFVIEYMGEVIDNVEFDQRFSRAKANKDDNYYFLTLGYNLKIDAKVYGNEARFINHSCDPNVAPNKWTVYSNGQEHIRIGFFALRKILPGEEITFDYNWGTKDMKTVCQCGSKKCRGHI